MNLVRGGFLLTLVLLLSGCGDGVPPAGNYATVTGIVTDAASGTPIASASVSINGVQYAQTDAAGKYQITTVPTGPWSWSASADGFATGGSDSPTPLAPGEKRDFPISLKHRLP